MYAIAFDLDTECLKQSYGQSYQNAYGEIKDFLSLRGFSKKQGSLYYGDNTVTMVSAIVAATEMGREFPWLQSCISDIRILQLVNNDDLKPALEMGFKMAGVPKPKKVAKKPRVLKYY